MAQEFRLQRRNGIEWLECAGLGRWPWVVHAFSTRRGGATALDLARPAGRTAARLERNQRAFLSALGAHRWPIASLRQIHSAAVWAVDASGGSGLRYFPALHPPEKGGRADSPPGDALVTAQPGILLGVRVADCLPVLLVDPRHRVIAAVHGGWRGLLRRVVEKTVGVMRALFGTDSAAVRAVIGPSIRVCCYAVGQEVVEAYAGAFVGAEKFFRRPPPEDSSRALRERYPVPFLSGAPPGHGRPAGPAAHLDLVQVARAQLAAAGVKEGNLWVSEFCTACREDLFFSHRRDGARAGRMMAVVGIRPGRG